MKNAFDLTFSILQKIGKSLMVPVSVLPAAGLLVALGRLLQDTAMENEVVTNVFLHSTGKLFFSGGLAIFEQLPVIFSIGVAIGFTGGAAIAGLASVVGYFTLLNILKVMGEIRSLELQINTGVFGGIIIGLVSALLYKRFFNTKLPQFLGFFAGKRLVPIVTAVAAVFVGLILGVVWPPIQDGINSFGMSIMSSEYGPAFYAAGKRLLIPVGLHHVYYPPFLYEFGEYVTAAGKVLNGESVRYFAGDPNAGKFMASEFPIMLFGLPAAALAMYLRAPKERRAAIGGVMLSAALTSIITGITEPIEFSFIFVAPLLYVFHVGAAFVSGLLTSYFDIHLGYTFSASMIDFAVGYFNQQNSSMLWLAVGPLVGLLYFATFYVAIPVFNFKTPGRDEAEAEDEISSSMDISDKAVGVLAALGGHGNIKELDACITRLRLTVNDKNLVDKAKLKSLGAAGVMTSGNNIQAIFGTQSEVLKEQIKLIPKETQATDDRIQIDAPMTGDVMDLSEVPDATFSGKLLGDGFAIDPKDGEVIAPISGTVAQLFHTNHAIGIVDENGLEVLIHIGIDTVKMKGEGFQAFVEQGAKVEKGQKLIEFDLDKVRTEAKSTITPIVFTNMGQVSDLELVSKGQINKNDLVCKVSLK